MQNLFFFFDDSGTLHISNDIGKFVYAGFVFTSRKDIDSARVRYTNLVKQIQKTLKTTRELKACNLRPKYKRALYNVLRKENSIALVVDISKTYDKILYSSHSICRYKDYILKIAIQTEIDKLIEANTLNPYEDISIYIYIDEQFATTDGIYGLREALKEEMQFGIFNYNYSKIQNPIFKSEVNVHLSYCDSKVNYMIQACDILANRIFCSYKYKKNTLRDIPNHLYLTFP